MPQYIPRISTIYFLVYPHDMPITITYPNTHMVYHVVFQRFAAKDSSHFHEIPLSQFIAIIWVNYNDLTATSLELIVSKGNHPQMALSQASEIL